MRAFPCPLPATVPFTPPPFAQIYISSIPDVSTATADHFHAGARVYELSQFPHPGSLEEFEYRFPTCLAVSDTGNAIAVGDDRGDLHVWELAYRSDFYQGKHRVVSLLHDERAVGPYVSKSVVVNPAHDGAVGSVAAVEPMEGHPGPLFVTVGAVDFITRLWAGLTGQLLQEGPVLAVPHAAAPVAASPVPAPLSQREGKGAVRKATPAPGPPLPREPTSSRRAAPVPTTSSASSTGAPTAAAVVFTSTASTSPTRHSWEPATAPVSSLVNFAAESTEEPLPRPSPPIAATPMSPSPTRPRREEWQAGAQPSRHAFAESSEEPLPRTSAPVAASPTSPSPTQPQRHDRQASTQPTVGAQAARTGKPASRIPIRKDYLNPARAFALNTLVSPTSVVPHDLMVPTLHSSMKLESAFRATLEAEVDVKVGR